MNLRLRSVGAVVLALSLAPLSTVAAADGSPWTPTRSSSFVAPAGSRCSFTLRGDVLADKELERVTETYADGSPKVIEVVGLLVYRFTNVESGASVVRNLTGTGLYELYPDGSFSLTLLGGHFAGGLQATDPGGPAFLVFTGAGYVLTIAADGTRTVTDGSGLVENICDTLAS